MRELQGHTSHAQRHARAAWVPRMCALRVTRTEHTGLVLRMSVRAYESREQIEMVEMIAQIYHVMRELHEP